MDELEFRRAIYADPHTDDPRVKTAIESDPAKKAFLAEMRQLDATITKAAKVDVPEDLASKLIWQGTMTEFATHKRKTRVHLALAASVAFVVGTGFTLWQQQAQRVDFSHEALAHMHYTEAKEGPRATAVSLNEVNGKLASFGASFTEQIGPIKSANYCRLDKVKTLHLIFESAAGLVSVFIVPDVEKGKFLSTFSDENFSGEKLDTQRANILVVGEKGQDLDDIKQSVKQNILFSA